MLPRPEDISPLEPDEFMDAMQYANMVAEHEFLEEVPAIGKPLFKTDEGALALTNIPENRFGLAIARHFRGQPEKIQSFMWRWWAVQRLFTHKRMRKFTRGQDDEREIHLAVFEAAATLPLASKYRFTPRTFFAEVDAIAERMARDEPNDA